MKYEVLKTALKKMECQRSRSSRNHINACSEIIWANHIGSANNDDVNELHENNGNIKNAKHCRFLQSWESCESMRNPKNKQIPSILRIARSHRWSGIARPRNMQYSPLTYPLFRHTA